MSDLHTSLVSPTALVEARLDADVLHITLKRPEEQNALNFEMMTALADLVEAGGDRAEVRAILISGAAEAFCSGDTPWATGPWPDRFKHRQSAGAHGSAPIVEQHMLRSVRYAFKPVVAALKGRVHGLGLDLAAVCDFRIAAEGAELSDPRILQGRHAATGLSYVLPRLIGQSRASWMLLTGEALSASEALRIGLVHRIHPLASLEAEALALTRHLAALPTRSYAVKKEMTLAQLDMSFEAAMMHCLAVRQTNVIEDREEGMRAWRERRTPQFTGR